MVTVLLFSDLFGSFADRAGSWSECAESYRRLIEEKVELIFVTGAPLAKAQEVLRSINPSPVICGDGGGSISIPEGHTLGKLGGSIEEQSKSLPGQSAAAQLVTAKYRQLGRIVITFGIGDSADDTFLRAVDVAALLPGDDGICSRIPRPRVTYVCKKTGRGGWNEWAEIMLKRVEVIGSRD